MSSEGGGLLLDGLGFAARDNGSFNVRSILIYTGKVKRGSGYMYYIEDAPV